jgi:hypothetical protein
LRRFGQRFFATLNARNYDAGDEHCGEHRRHADHGQFPRIPLFQAAVFLSHRNFSLPLLRLLGFLVTTPCHGTTRFDV